MKNVLVIFGGMTPEHNGSCRTTADVLDYIDRSLFNPITLGITLDGRWYYTEATSSEIRDAQGWEKSPTNRKAMLDTDYGAHRLMVFEENGIRYVDIDCIFVRMAGNTGEDGKLQGLMDLTGIPYVGSGVAASACGMDKEISYLFADSIGMRRPLTAVVLKKQFEADPDAAVSRINTELVAKTGWPVFVKPTSTGSSIGISKVYSTDELIEALKLALSYGDKVVLEENISGSEIKVAVLGNDDPEFGAICEILPNGEFNDYDAKYLSHSSTKNIPPDFPEELNRKIIKSARDYYRLLGCRGFSRVDFFLTPAGELVFNEINTNPGFCFDSIYSVMFRTIGVDFTEQITRLINTCWDN